MAQPEYVPTVPRAKVSERLPTPQGWRPDRPGEVVQRGGQPVGPRFGIVGPDQGYALKLVHQWEDKLVLTPGERKADTLAGGVAVATKRAGVFRRAPVTFDLELGFAIWGFLINAGTDLVSFRKPLFEGCAHSYSAQREIADRVPEHTLRLTPAEVHAKVRAGAWSELLIAD